MPLNAKGQKILASMKKRYGDRAEEVFYRSKNKGTISGVEARRAARKVSSKKKKRMSLRDAEKAYLRS